MSMTRRAANGTCVAPCKEKGVFVEILRMFSVAHLSEASSPDNA